MLGDDFQSRYSDDDKLFQCAGDDVEASGDLEADVRKNVGYSVGFHWAASFLLNNLMDGQGPLHCAVFPVVYLYRHYIELEMKDIIETISGEPPPFSHDLKVLWKTCNELLENNRFGRDMARRWIGMCIDEWEDIDPGSLGFGASGFKYDRYLATRNQSGSRTLAKLDGIDLGNFRRVVTKLCEEIGAVTDWWSEGRE